MAQINAFPCNNLNNGNEFSLLLYEQPNGVVHFDHDHLSNFAFYPLTINQGPVARSMVSANHWLRRIESFTFLW